MSARVGSAWSSPASSSAAPSTSHDRKSIIFGTRNSESTCGARGAGPCSRLAAPLLGLPDRCWLPVKVRISLVGAIADGVFELGLR